MDVGAAVIFQNPGQERTDQEVYAADLALADLAEPLGFDSIWTVEHHFTDYTMCPDPVQFLTYMAGRTSRVKLGSMVVVLPWHDPLRAAEQIAMLDTISGGRMILGIGRGAGKVEFDRFRMPMEESRPRFVEAARMVLEGLERGYCEFDGEYYQQPRADLRPKPAKSFRGRTYAAAVSPESSEIMAQLGIGILIIPQKPWDEVGKELDKYRAIYRQVNASDPPPPIVGGWVFCDEDPQRAKELARRYIGGYWGTVLDHYEFGKGHLRNVKGYEYYGKFADTLQKVGEDVATDFFMNLQVWGTPDQCYDSIMKSCDRVGADAFTGVFSYAGMPAEEAERNMRLFADKVMPRLKQVRPAAERLRDVA